MTKATVTNQGRPIATKGTPHAAIAQSPDICRVPGVPAPAPFPNFVESAKLDKGATTTVQIAGQPVWTSAGELGPPSEPAHDGTLGGVSSGRYRGEALPTSYSTEVFFEGAAAVRMDDTTTQNHRNTVGKVVEVPEGADLAAMARDAIGGDLGIVGDPIDVVTGRMFTRPVTDLHLPGPLPLELSRTYSSAAAHRDVGLGYGWTHSLGWELVIRPEDASVWTDQGVAVHFPSLPPSGGEVAGPWGYVLTRDETIFAVDAGDGLLRIFLANEATLHRHRLVAIVDSNGNATTITYAAGRIADMSDSAGRFVRVSSTAKGRMEAIEVRSALPDGPWVRFALYRYDPSGNLVSVTDADGFSCKHDYDERHLMTSSVDRAGLGFRYVYDEQARCIESWGVHGEQERDGPSFRRDVSKETVLLADGRTPSKGIHHVQIEYGDGGHRRVTGLGQVRTFAGTEHGTLGKSITAGGVTDRAYREDARLVLRRDPSGGTTTFERDARGRVLRVVDPLERATTIERDANGNALRIADPRGSVTEMTYDRRGNMSALRDGSGAVTCFCHDERGLVTGVTHPGGTQATIEYDEQGNTLSLARPEGVWRWTYDALGRTISETDPHGGTTHYSYSPRGDLIAVRDAMGGVTRYHRDGEQHLVRVVDPNGRTIEQGWGSYHRLLSRKDGGGGAVTLEYDGEARLVGLGYPTGAIKKWTHGAQGVRAITDAFGRTTSFTYDPCSRPISKLDPSGVRTEYVYDRAGQLIGKCYSDRTPAVAYTYDGCGRLTSASTAGDALVRTYDAVGRLVSESSTANGSTVSYTYDREGRPRTIALGDRLKISYERDDVGRLITIRRGSDVFAFGYDRAFRRTRLEYPNGVVTRYAYDALSRLVELDVSRGQSVLYRASYTYDAASNRTAKIASDGREDYGYDGSYRLIHVSRDGAPSESYEYDSIGNRVPTGANWTHDVDLPLSTGRAVLAYDPSGNLVRRQEGGSTVTYEWDAEGRLLRVARDDAELAEFRYDPLGRRIAKIAGGVAKSYVYAGWDILFAGVGGGAGRAYVHGPGMDEPLGMEDESGASLFYHADGLGSIVLMTDRQGNVVSKCRYGAFGEILDASPGFEGHSYTGREWDPEIGLYYMRARYYDPTLGGFISNDPIGLASGSVNMRAYVSSNPATFTDPMGLAERGDVVFFNWYGKDYPGHAAIVTEIDANGNPTKAFGAWGDTHTFHEVDLSEYRGGVMGNIVGTGSMAGLNDGELEAFTKRWQGRSVDANWGEGTGFKGYVCVDAATAADGYGGAKLRSAMADVLKSNPAAYPDLKNENGKPFVADAKDPFFYRKNPRLVQFFTAQNRFTPASRKR